MICSAPPPFSLHQVWKEAMNDQEDGFPYLFSAFAGIFLYGGIVQALLSPYNRKEDITVWILALATVAATFFLETQQVRLFSVMNLVDVISGTYGPTRGSHQGSIFPLSQRRAVSNLLPLSCNFGVVSGKFINAVSSAVGPHAASIFWHLALFDYVLRLMNNTSSSRDEAVCRKEATGYGYNEVRCKRMSN